jgi:tetratricopeptide (TPR) repeat protein
MDWGGVLPRLLGAALALAALPAATLQAQTVRPVQAQEAVQILAAGDVSAPTPFRLLLVGNDRRLWLRWQAGEVTQDVPLTVPMALSLLVDRRYSFLWDALTAWAGDDLSRLRDAHIAFTANALASARVSTQPRTTAESVLDPRSTALLRYSDALMAAGRFDEAVGVLRAALPQRLRGDEALFNYSILSSSIARGLVESGDLPGAVATLRAAAARLGSSPYRSNVLVNRAAYLARSGQYQEALRDVDEAEAIFAESSPGVAVAGSLRQFSWIRACVFHGLGQTAQARALAAAVEAAEEPPPRWDLVLESSENIRRRMRFCMNDTAEVIADLKRAADEGRLALYFALFEPSFRSPAVPPSLLQAVQSNPRLQAAASEQMRPLPPSLLPALRRWQAPDSR